MHFYTLLVNYRLELAYGTIVDPSKHIHAHIQKIICYLAWVDQKHGLVYISNKVPSG